MMNVRADFLQRYCPDPALVEAAIERLGLWTVHEYLPDQVVCRAGELAEACWIIVEGQAEIVHEGESIAFRRAGEMIGEQALLSTLIGKEGRRAADIVSRGGLKTVCFG